MILWLALFIWLLGGFSGFLRLQKERDKIVKYYKSLDPTYNETLLRYGFFIVFLICCLLIGPISRYLADNDPEDSK